MNISTFCLRILASATILIALFVSKKVRCHGAASASKWNTYLTFNLSLKKGKLTPKRNWKFCFASINPSSELHRLSRSELQLPELSTKIKYTISDAFWYFIFMPWDLASYSLEKNLIARRRIRGLSVNIVENHVLVYYDAQRFSQYFKTICGAFSHAPNK